MTDLVPPPDDPESQLLWAREVLAQWSQDPEKYRGVLGWELILASARAILKQHEPASNPLHSPPYPPASRGQRWVPNRRSARPRKPPPPKRRR